MYKFYKAKALVLPGDESLHYKEVFMFIVLHSSHETLLFAGNEFKKGLNKAGILNVNLLPSTAYEGEQPAIHLGSASDLKKFSHKVETSEEDCFQAEISQSKGFLVGSNPRSVLFAVYDTLRFMGFEWVNPKSEIFEARADFKKEGLSYQITKRASTFHRGIVFEGSASLENVLDIIDWLPKLYFNSYFIQFKLPYHFFMNWYQHTENSFLEPQPFDEQKAEKLKAAIELALKKRSLLYHAVGHAWTCESIGVRGLTWDRSETLLNDKQKELTALVNGKRGLFGGVTLNTNLCYENPEALNAFTREVLSYLQDNPDIDYLHIWLADGLNNFCECPSCMNKLPSDQYIKVLNQLDEVLSEKKIDTKLVFLIYFDLLYAPKTETLKNPDRFVLMFAPITRSFEASYEERGSLSSSPSYIKNKIYVPVSIDENLSFLSDWQKIFKGDSFVFDYPLGRAHYGDTGYLKISKILFGDIRSLKDLGLGGYLSCQEQRAFFPNGLPNFTMGLALFDESLSFEEIASHYFRKTYGERGEEVFGFLEELSSLMNMDYWNTHLEKVNKEIASSLEKIPALMENFKPLIDEMKQRFEKEGDAYHFEQWKLLSHLINHASYFSKTLFFRAQGEEEQMKENFKLLSAYLKKNELNIQPYLDVFRFLNLSRFNIRLEGEKD